MPPVKPNGYFRRNFGRMSVEFPDLGHPNFYGSRSQGDDSAGKIALRGVFFGEFDHLHDHARIAGRTCLGYPETEFCFSFDDFQAIFSRISIFPHVVSPADQGGNVEIVLLSDVSLFRGKRFRIVDHHCRSFCDSIHPFPCDFLFPDTENNLDGTGSFRGYRNSAHAAG